MYRITNLISNKIYIGVHKNKIESADDEYMGSGKHLKYAQRKYGIENFKKEVLELFDTYDFALDKERIIVDEVFIKRKDTYNIRIGGRGGNFSKEDAIRGAKKGGQVFSEKINALKEEEYNEYRSLKKEHSDLGVAAFKNKYEEHNGIWWKPANKGLAHTEETLNKMRGKRPQSSGNNNSQYGTIWITNGTDNKKIKKDIDIPTGWRKGRK